MGCLQQVLVAEATVGGGTTDFITDTFTEGSNVNLNAHTGELGATWTRHTHSNYTSATLNVDAATDRVWGGGTTAYHASGTPGTADYYAQGDFYLASAISQNIAVCVRMDTSADTMYYARLNNGTVWELRKLVNGVATNLATSNDQLPTVGNSKTGRLEVTGSSLSFWINEVLEIGPVTDTSISAAGRAGIRNAGVASASTGIHIDNFSARGISAPAGGVPQAPSDLVATDAASPVLTWSDNSDNETSFRIERKTGAGSFAEIGSVAANVSTYIDNAVTASTTYTYRVRARNGTGDSTYSNEDSATAQTPPPLVGSDFILGPQIPIGTAWFDTNQVTKGLQHGAAFPAVPPTDPAGSDAYVLAHYYDLAMTMYQAYKRTNNATFLSHARKVADSWWKHPYTGEGTVRQFDIQGTAPRHAGLGGLMLRAIDGRPEMWDWVVAYTQYHFNLWLKLRINDSTLYYGLREGAFMLHYATWLAKVLPDTYPLQAGGTGNGVTARAAFLADIESIVVNYHDRLQFPDGSWRWTDHDVTDEDGGILVGIMQPFMVGLLMCALIDVHLLTTNASVKANIQNQITTACTHLYSGGPYRINEPTPFDTSKRWRSFWYLYHGGTSVNPTKFQNGGWSLAGTQAWEVKSERQSIATLFPCFAYAYEITGNQFYKTAAQELYDAAFVGTDGIRNEADGTAKNYNQNYRRGGSYFVWIA